MRRLLVLAAASTLLAAAPARAHIQVSPSVAAPGDLVMFQLLVPNERTARTVEVRLKVPSDVLPFSYEEPAGWKRHLTLADNGATDVVRWRGRLGTDGFTRFAFLASTPEKPTTLVWKAIQTYSDGKDVAWIGAPGSSYPAAVTVVKEGAPRQNAGGEGRPAASAPAAAAPAAPTVATGSDADSPLALILGASGLLLGGAALTLTLVRGRRS